jgi:hypothetical protein
MKLLAISTLAIVLTSAMAGKKSSHVGKKGKKGSDDCFSVYELSTSGTFDDYVFTGVVPATTGDNLVSFSTPFFYSSDAEGEVAGRVQGFYVNLTPDGDTSVGNWAFHFFEEESWLVAPVGFGVEETPTVITGASGIFRGSGSIVNTEVSTDPLIIEWKICGTL